MAKFHIHAASLLILPRNNLHLAFPAHRATYSLTKQSRGSPQGLPLPIINSKILLSQGGITIFKETAHALFLLLGKRLEVGVSYDSPLFERSLACVALFAIRITERLLRHVGSKGNDRWLHFGVAVVEIAYANSHGVLSIR